LGYMSTPFRPRHDPAAYLQALREPLERASQSRKGWIGEVGRLMADLRSGRSRDLIATVAGRSGAGQAAAFGAVRVDLVGLEPAAGCEGCHLAVLGWLDKQIAACDLMVEIGRSGEVERLREVLGLIAEARHDARQFSYEIAERRAALGHRRRAVALVRARALEQRQRGRRPPAPWDAAPAPVAARASLWGRVARLFGADAGAGSA
jgi:hypothetical protein